MRILVDSEDVVVCDRAMAIVLGQPEVDGLGEALVAHREWQHEQAPLQLHPGDLGWQWRFGAEATAAAVRIWSREAEVLAIGFLDEPTLLRLAIAPGSQRDEELAHRLAQDIAEPERGVLRAGKATLEVTSNALVHGLLVERGWVPDEPWTQLRRDLRQQISGPDMRIEVVGPDHVLARTVVQRAAFDTSTFTEDRWHAMAAGLPYADARCLVGYDDQGRAVAAVTVWSAGAGRPGLLEPLGVHRDHRGRGYGTEIGIAAAVALQRMGSSSALVCTPSANVGAVATYMSAGFQKLADVRDLARNVGNADA